MALDIIQTLWIGDTISPLEKLSFSSFLAAGHPVHLYTYGDIQGLPDGINTFDANSIIPEREVFRYQEGLGKGSVAGFADVFRYKLLLEKGNWWVDTDVVCLKPFQFANQHVFAWQGPFNGEHFINNAVMKSPPGSPLLAACYERALAFDGSAPWGTSGPRLLTPTIQELGYEHFALSRESFYPIHFSETDKLIEDGQTLAEAESYAVHFWNEMWRRNGLDKYSSYPEHSIFEKLKKRFLT